MSHSAAFNDHRLPAGPAAQDPTIGALRFVAKTLFFLLTTRQVTGLENIPTQGPCLLVFNHVSNFDPPLVFSLLRRTDVAGLAAANYRVHLRYRLLMERTGAIWLRRGESDRAALRTALAVLERGGIVGVAPEGRRSPTKSLQAGKPGPAFLASRANVLVVPMGLANTDRLATGLKRMERVNLQVRVGKPFRLPRLEQRDVKMQLQHDTDLIMCHIAALLPPRYRGVYADHPFLQTLLSETAEFEAFAPTRRQT